MSRRFSVYDKIISIYSQKIKGKKWEIVAKFLPLIFAALPVIWLLGIFMQFLNGIIIKDYTMFKDYGMIALTAFGFTLIGGIFEKRKDHSKIEIELLDSSLSFLITAIAFLFMYSLSSVLPLDMDQIQTYIVVGSFSVTMFIGFMGMTSGFLDLLKILIHYRVELNKKVNKT